MTDFPRRYYWMKVSVDFHNSHTIKVLEGSSSQGLLYAYFYERLLCHSVYHDGRLRYSDSRPYSEDDLASLTGIPSKVAMGAIPVLKSLGVMVVESDGTFFFPEVQDMIGSETSKAGIMRNLRRRRKGENGPEDGNKVTKVLPNCYPNVTPVFFPPTPPNKENRDKNTNPSVFPPEVLVNGHKSDKSDFEAEKPAPSLADQSVTEMIPSEADVKKWREEIDCLSRKTMMTKMLQKGFINRPQDDDCIEDIDRILTTMIKLYGHHNVTVALDHILKAKSGKDVSSKLGYLRSALVNELTKDWSGLKAWPGDPSEDPEAEKGGKSL